MKRAIVTGGTKDDTAPMAVFAINLKETNADLFDELVIFHDGIKEKDKCLINAIFPTRFVEYKYPSSSKNDEVLTHFSPMIFCKYECFRLLEEYELVVWSDYDVVIYGRLDEFCKIDGYDFHILSSNSQVKDMFLKNISIKEICQYDLTKEAVGTPLFALSNKLPNYQEIFGWCYEKTAKWDADLYLPEQCIFSLAVQQFNIPQKRFEFSQYACYPSKAKGGEIIIHAAGQPKFWNGLDNENWQRMYSEWIEKGGSRYSDFRKKLKRTFLFIVTRLCGVRGKEHY